MRRDTIFSAGCLILSVLSVMSPVPFADDADDPKQHYKRGLDLQQRGDLVQAVGEFEAAVRLRPRNHRYSEALQQAKDQAVTGLITKSQYIDDPQEQIRLLDLAVKLAPSEPRPQLLLNDLNTKALSSEKTVQLALEKHKTGELAECPSLSALLHKWKPLLSNYDELESCAQAETLVSLAEYDLTIEAGAVQALNAAWEALHIEPDWSRARKVSSKAAQRVEEETLDELSTTLAQQDPRIVLRTVATAIKLAEAYQLSDSYRIRVEGYRKKAVQKTQSFLAGIAVGNDPSGKFVKAMVRQETAETGLTDLVESGGVDDAPAALNVVVKVEARTDACDSNRLLASLAIRLQDALGTAARIVSPGEPSSMVLLHAKFSDIRCSRTDLDSTEVQLHPSTYKAGDQYIPNPRYLALAQELDQANQQMNRIALLMASDPNNLGYAFAMGSWRRRANQAQAEMQRTPAQLTEPLGLAYEYETYKQVRSIAIEGTVSVVDEEGRLSTTPAPFQEAEQSEDTGTRGVLDADMGGHRNKTPSVSDWSRLEDKLYASAAAKASALAVGMILEAEESRACVAAKHGASSSALAHGIVVRDLAAATGTETAGDAAAPALDEIFAGQEAVREAMATFARTCRSKMSSIEQESAAGRPREESRSKGSEVVGSVLPSVVYISTAEGFGSGFVVAPDLVVTNDHVVANAPRVEVRTHQGDVFLGEVVGRNEHADLALVRTKASRLPPLRLGRAADARVGDEVFALGQPFGLKGTVTKGIVSALRAWEGVGLVQVDAPINPGNSGGPLVDDRGTVIGVNSFAISKTIGEGIGFAVSVDEIRKAFTKQLGGQPIQ